MAPQPLFTPQMQANGPSRHSLVFNATIDISRIFLDVTDTSRYLHGVCVHGSNGGVVAAHEDGRPSLPHQKWAQKPFTRLTFRKQ